MLFQNSLGINFQKGSVSIVFLQSSFSGIQVAASVIHEFGQGMSFDKKLALSVNITRHFIEENNVLPADIFIGIPREMVVMRELVFPIAVKENLKRTIRYEMEKYVPIPVDNIYYDCQVIREDKAKDQIRVLLTVIKKIDFDPVLQFIHEMGAGVSGVEIESTAIVNSLSLFYDESVGSTYAAMVKYDDQGEIIVVDRGVLRTSKILPSNLTKEKSDIAEMVHQAFNSLPGFLIEDASLLKTVYLGGNEDTLQDSVTLPSGMEITPFDNESFELRDIRFLPAYGLAIKGLKKVPMALNFLPESLRKAPSKTGYYVAFILSCVVVLLGLVWGGSKFMHQRQIETFQHQEILRLSSEVKRVEEVREKARVLENKINSLNSITSNRIFFTHILNEMSSLLPKSCWIKSLDYKSNDVRIEGTAVSAASLIPILEDSPLFYDVAFLKTITKDSSGKDKFSIGIKIKKF